MGLTDFQNGFALGLSSGGIVALGGSGVDQIQADYAQYDSTAVDFIKNKEFYWEPATEFDVISQTISLGTQPYSTEALGAIIPIENFPILIPEQEIYTFTLQHQDVEYVDVPLKFYDIEGGVVAGGACAAGNANLIFDEANIDCPDVPYCFIFAPFEGAGDYGLGIFFSTENVSSGECQFKLKCNLKDPITIESLQAVTVQTVTIESETKGMIMKEPSDKAPGYMLQEDTEIEVFLDNKSQYKGFLKKATMANLPFSYLYLGNLDLLFQIMGESTEEVVYTPSDEDYCVMLTMGMVIIISPELTAGTHDCQINLNCGIRIQKLATKYIDYDFDTIQNVSKKGSGEFSVILNNYDNHEVIDSYNINEANGAFSIAMGNHTQAYGNNSHSEGEGTLAYGDNSHSEGYLTRALGNQSHAEGYGGSSNYKTIISGGSLISDSTNQICYSGNRVSSIAPYIRQYVYLSNSYPNDIFDFFGNKSKIEISDVVYDSALNYTIVSFYSSINDYYEDLLSENIGIYDIANGAIGGHSHTEGYGTTASGNYSHAEGGSTITRGDASHAEGRRTIANGESSHAEGDSTIASSTSSHAEGQSTTASGSASHTEGQSTIASGDASHAEGQSTIASGDASHAEGWDTTASGYGSHVEGYQTTVSGNYSHAEGDSTNKVKDVLSNFNSSTNKEIIEAWESKKFSLAKGDGSHVEGTNCLGLGDYSHAEGHRTIARGKHSHAEGTETTVSGDNSHAEGYQTTVSGHNSHAEGYGTTASGYSSHAEGYSYHKAEDVLSNFNSSTNEEIIEAWESKGFSLAKGDGSHVEGTNCLSLGYQSHAEGNGTIASESFSHAEGSGTIASGSSSHAEGSETTASGNYSHAEGLKTTASGVYSHAEGHETTASELNSHAEGYNTTASGSASHAEGQSTTANGAYSHAQGYNTTASGSASHAEGWSTTASGDSSHVQGKYNIEDTEDKYAHIVGNGEDNANRSNAHTLDWDGNAWFAGKATAKDIVLEDASGTVIIESLLAKIQDLEARLATLEGN